MLKIIDLFVKSKKTNLVFRVILLAGVIFINLGVSAWVQTGSAWHFRVGVYENAPKIYTDESGNVNGFWPAILNDIARQENWQLEWVHCSWDECLTLLKNGEIDMMPDVGYNPERAELFDFSDQTVLSSWSRVYKMRGSTIETILDLDGKTVGGLVDSINFDGSEGIRDLAQQFNLHCTFMEYDSYPALFEALEKGEIDAGVVNKDFGNKYENQYDVERTPIIFQPVQIRFAFPKHAAQTPYLIKTIDQYISRAKENTRSNYYIALETYLGEGAIGSQTSIPLWVYWVLSLAVLGILFLVAVNRAANRRVKKQTAELSMSDARMRALVENLPDLMLRMDSGANILDIQSNTDNENTMFSRSLIGKSVSEVLPDLIAKAYEYKISSCLMSNKVEVLEYEVPVGQYNREYEARFNASVNDEVIIIVRDITERKHAEKELIESEERYQTLANFAPVGIFHTDLSGYTTYVNPTWCRMSGLSVDKALGYGWLDAVHEDDRPNLIQGWRSDASQKKQSLADYRFVHKDGSVVWVIGQATPEMNADHEIVGYVGTITDITERKENEVVLRQAITAEKEALALAGTIQAANLALSNLLSRDEVLDVLMEYLAKLIPYDRAAVFLVLDEQTLRMPMRSAKGFAGMENDESDTKFAIQDYPLLEKILTEKHGLIIPNKKDISTQPSPYCFQGNGSWIGIPLIAAGEVLGVYILENQSAGVYGEKDRELAESVAAQAAVAIKNASLHDELTHYAADLENRVYERTAELRKRVMEVESYNETMHQLMEELTVALNKAESADRLKSAFLATMSHELRTPLNSIIGFTGILLQNLVGPLNEEQHKQLKMVQGSANHLLELINDVLDISKIEAGQVDIHKAQFDFGQAAQHSIEKITPLAEKKGLMVTCSGVDRPLLLNSDQRRVEQVLINLLNNAVKFSDRGEVALQVEQLTDEIVVTVRDTGIGIAADQLQNLFLPFRQIDSGLTRQYEGTGLGLSICKRLVELLGGEIEVKSELGKGSQFIFTLPFPGMDV